jgi:hypothetical protein
MEHIIVDAQTGTSTTVPFSPQEWADVQARIKPALQEALSDLRRRSVSASALIDLGTRSIPVWTDADSRGSIMGLVLALQSSPSLSVQWLGADGLFYTLTPAEISALATGVLVFVQTAFAKQALIAAQIESGALTTLEQVTAAFNS